MSKPKYDSTVARIAGNIASGLVGRRSYDEEDVEIAEWSVRIARAVVAEVQRTTPVEPE